MRLKRYYSLTEGPLLPAIVRFSLPLMLSNVLQVLFSRGCCGKIQGKTELSTTE